MAEAKALLTRALASRHATPAQRCEAFQALHGYLQGADDLPAPVVKAALQVITGTAHVSRDSKTRQVVLDIAGTLLSGDSKEAAATAWPPLLRKLSEPVQRAARPEGFHLVILRWTVLAAQLGREVYAQADSAWDDLVAAQASVLAGALSRADSRIARSAARCFTQALAKEPALAPMYCQTIARAKPQATSMLVVAGALVDASSDKTCMEGALGVFETGVLLAKTPPPPGLLVSSRSFLGAISHDQFKDRLLPTILKAIKRNSGACLQMLSAVLPLLRIDLSRYGEELLGAIAPLLTGSNTALYASAADAVRQLILRCSDSSMHTSLSSSLLKSMTAKSLKWEQRRSIIEALRSFSECQLTGSGKQSAFASVVAGLLTEVKKEKHEATKMAGLEAVARFLRQIKQPSEEVVAALAAELEAKSSTAGVRSAALECLYAGFTGDSVPQMAPLQPTLTKLLGRKPAHQSAPEATLAAALVLRLCFFAREHNEQADKDGLWALVGSGCVNASKLLAGGAASPATLEAFGFVATSMLTRGGAEEGPWASGLAEVMLLAPHAARKAVAGMVAGALAVAAPAVAHGLRDGLAATMDRLYAAGDEDAWPSTNAALRALWTVATPCPGEQATDVVTEVVVTLHHPLVRTGGAPVIARLLRTLGVAEPSYFQGCREALVGRLHAVITEALSAAGERPVGLQAARTALRVLSQLPSAADAVGHVVEGVVCAFLRSGDVLAVSARDMGVHATADGMVFGEKVEEVDEIAALNKNSKDYADKKWELEVKRELAAKKKAAGARAGAGKKGAASGAAGKPKLSKKQEDLRNAKLADEAALRAKVQGLQDEARVVFCMLDALVDGAPEALRPHTPLLVSVLSAAWSRSHLVALQCVLAFRRLAASLPGQIEPAVRDAVANAVARSCGPPVCNLSGQGWAAEPLGDLVVRATRLLYSATHERAPLPDTSLALCLPLLQEVLGRGPHPLAAMEDALITLNDHAAVIGRSSCLQRHAVTELLSHVVLQHERLAHQAAVLLVAMHGHMGAAVADGAVLVTAADLRPLTACLYTVSADLRLSCLKSLLPLPLPEAASDEAAEVVAALWLAMHDPNAQNAALARTLWEGAGYGVRASMCACLMTPLESPHEVIRQAAAAALGEAVEQHGLAVQPVVEVLLGRYEALMAVPEVRHDKLGNVIRTEHVDPWQGRCGVAGGLAALAPVFEPAALLQVFRFFVHVALHDHHSGARDAVLAAGMKLLDRHGAANVGALVAIFEDYLASGRTSSASHDTVRQSVVVLLGSLAKHLDKTDPRIPGAIDTLVDALATPSQQVQQAVADCLPPLISGDKTRGPPLIQQLMAQLMGDERYAKRRGAAYGLAGVVKGCGILVLKKEGVMDALTEAIQDKKVSQHREGALMAFEMLCLTLGRLFEPYVIHVLPHLLVCYGDGNKDVRAATIDTSRAIMSKLSGHGVKLVLPSLLTALDDDAWRTKQGSAELLGAMAYCAPKQLSTCLPMIVPRLAEVLTDTHLKVEKAGRDALQSISSVIKNPEIQAIVPTIILALSDPVKHINEGLAALLETHFVHVIDAPSLALIMPIVQRALVARSGDTKKKSAQIIGNMYSLTDGKDLVPYLPELLPGLKTALMDPSPEVRSITAKALGSMVKGMGEAHFAELVPWLLGVLRADGTTVDRSGAAQGLSEILAALGVDRLDAMMPDFVAAAGSPVTSVREGHLMLFVYLPITFGDDFVKYLPDVIPPVLAGLADAEETVRETAMRGGQRIIANYSETAVELLLPQLLLGMVDEVWRIRESSVLLLGDLLFKLAGTSGNKNTAGGEDATFGTESGTKALIDALGEQRRNQVLARVFLGRQDVNHMVRQASSHVWKVVVSHTAAALRDILPSLVSFTLEFLASENPEQRQVGGKSVGEVVRKLGERVLPDIFPILQAELESPSASTREGVCLGMSEIMASTTKDTVSQYTDSLIPAIRRALCDPEAAVREAAARTFVELHSNIGSEAIDGVLPPILAQLEGSDGAAEFAMDGLRQIMSSKSKLVLPFLVPRLVATPVSAFNARALASLSAVAGESLNRWRPEIMRALLASVSDPACADYVRAIKEGINGVVTTVPDSGAAAVVEELVKELGHAEAARRINAAELLRDLVEEGAVDLADHREAVIEGLLGVFGDGVQEVLTSAWAALGAVLKTLPAGAAIGYRDIRHLTTAVGRLTPGADGHIAGFCIPRGVGPLVPLYVDAVASGTPELKVLACKGIAALVRLTAAAALKPFVVKMAGPLIRVSGEQAPAVRAEALAALCVMLAHVGAALKPFLPQLQPTFVKALRDQTREVRVQAAQALGRLIVLQSAKRVDPMLTELAGAVKTTTGDVTVTVLRAVQAVLRRGGDGASDKARAALCDALLPRLQDEDEQLRTAAAAAVGVLARILDPAALAALLQAHVMAKGKAGGDWALQHARATALQTMLHVCPGNVLAAASEQALVAAVEALLRSDNAAIAETGVDAATGLWLHAAATGEASASLALGAQAAQLLETQGSDAQDAILRSLKKAAKVPGLARSVRLVLAPAVLKACQNGTARVKKTGRRTLLHIMGLLCADGAQTPDSAAVLDAFLKECKPHVASDLRAYHKRALAAAVQDESEDEMVPQELVGLL